MEKQVSTFHYMNQNWLVIPSSWKNVTSKCHKETEFALLVGSLTLMGSPECYQESCLKTEHDRNYP